jgi:hypothetical protein
MPVWPCQINAQCSAEQLRRLGPLLPAWWVPLSSVEAMKRSEGSVLLDTGAPGMMIDDAIATALKYPAQGEEEIHGAHGYGIVRKYIGKLALPIIDSSGETLALGIPAECTGIPHLSERYARDGISVVGVLGRNFLQFCRLEIDGLSGRVFLRIDESVLLPRE